ncbi:hypothetical protein EVAR_33222_1 [Eumeta japonica]|uniref:Uncharacterized protein n=1 Tax=Eumeta variegata TaxID=151549 RepID=A0A4C1W4W0_EUMVA|nr:hypothetical protein EVAR_33222_1 [Eumeta japonica]
MPVRTDITQSFDSRQDLRSYPAHLNSRKKKENFTFLRHTISEKNDNRTAEGEGEGKRDEIERKEGRHESPLTIASQTPSAGRPAARPARTIVCFSSPSLSCKFIIRLLSRNFRRRTDPIVFVHLSTVYRGLPICLSAGRSNHGSKRLAIPRDTRRSTGAGGPGPGQSAHCRVMHRRETVFGEFKDRNGQKNNGPRAEWRGRPDATGFSVARPAPAPAPPRRGFATAETITSLFPFREIDRDEPHLYAPTRPRYFVHRCLRSLLSTAQSPYAAAPGRNTRAGSPFGTSKRINKTSPVPHTVITIRSLLWIGTFHQCRLVIERGGHWPRGGGRPRPPPAAQRRPCNTSDDKKHSIERADTPPNVTIILKPSTSFWTTLAELSNVHIPCIDLFCQTTFPPFQMAKPTQHTYLPISTLVPTPSFKSHRSLTSLFLHISFRDFQTYYAEIASPPH